MEFTIKTGSPAKLKTGLLVLGAFAEGRLPALSAAADGAAEGRLAALIADPGQWDQRDNVVKMLPLSDEEKAAFPNIDLSKLDPIQQWFDSPDVDPVMKWRVVRRGFWVNGVSNFADYAVGMCDYTLSDRASNITCPTLVTEAVGDPVAANARLLF